MVTIVSADRVPVNFCFRESVSALVRKCRRHRIDVIITDLLFSLGSEPVRFVAVWRACRLFHGDIYFGEIWVVGFLFY